MIDMKEDIYGHLTISMSSAYQIGQDLQGIGNDLIALSDEFKDLRTTLLECDEDAFASELTAVYQQLAQLVNALGNAHQEIKLELKPFGALFNE